MRVQLILAIIFIFIFSSCKDQYNICDTSLNVSLNGGFYHRTSTSETAAMPPAFTLFLLNTNTNLYNQQAGLQKWSMSLFPQTDTARYFVKLSNSSIADTITFSYSSLRVTLPEPCGYIYTNSLSAVSSTRHTIDTITIVNPAVGTTGALNIKLYF